MEIQKDIGAEVIQTLEKINDGIIKIKEKLAEKDKRILELEYKLKEYEQSLKEDSFRFMDLIKKRIKIKW